MAVDAFRSITIKGFRSIRSIDHLSLRPINLLIGANGSGKSNFLEAIRFWGEAEAGRRDAYVEHFGGANRILHFGSKTTHEVRISVDCAGGGMEAEFRFAANDRLVGDAYWHGKRPAGPSFNRYRFRDTGEDSPLRTTNDLHNNRALMRLGSNLASFLYMLKQQYPSSYLQVRDSVRLVAPFFEDFLLEPMLLNKDKIILEWRHTGSDEYFDVASLSDGTLTFIALATVFLQPLDFRPSVILIDEPELGLHPYAIELLASLIRQASHETQIIVATQSSLLLDYFDPEDILVADRVDGATEIRRLDSPSLSEWLKDYSLGQLWEKGELAGRPVNE